MPQARITFFGNDWRSDARLRLCSAASRGVWIDLMTFMMEAEPFGSLLINGKRPAIKDLAALTVTPVKVIENAMVELEERGVFSRDPDGTIFSRRMRRDAERAAEARENGKRGGNPKLKGTGKGGDNSLNKSEDNASGYGHGLTPNITSDVKPHARVPVSSSSSDKDSVPDGTGAEAPSIEAEVFRRGKKLLGQRAGGQITKLRQALKLDDIAALALLNEAATKENPAEWVAGVLRRRSAEPETDDLGLPVPDRYDADAEYRRMGVEF